MTRIWKKLAWSLFALSLTLLFWYIFYSLFPGERARFYLLFALGVTLFVCIAVHILLSMRPAYRWLTVGAAAAAVIFGLQSLAHGENLSLWLILPGFFGIVWIRYIVEFRGGDFEYLNRKDVYTALAITLLVGVFVLVILSLTKYIQTRGRRQSPATQELIEWE